MPTDALSRPAALNLCGTDDRLFSGRRDWSSSSRARDDWSPSSNESDELYFDDRDNEEEADDDSAASNDSTESNESATSEPEPSPAAPALSSAPLRLRQSPLASAVPRPSPLALKTGARAHSPPRSSPLSPLARSSASSATASQTVTAPRLRPRGLSPLSSTTPSLPKATPLARTLLNRAVSNGSPAARPKKTTKMIVPTKPFRTNFELSLSATELARKA